MTRFFGYGEDGLTMWAFTRHLPLILKELKDGSNVEDCSAFYRPSFGRAGGDDAAPFGEFDVILATPRAVYPFEDKWDGARSIINRQIVLEPRQILRHSIFRWYREQWNEQKPPTWEKFLRHNAAAFQASFHGKPLAPSGSRLASNLEYVLRALGKFPSTISDVLLYFHRDGQPLPVGVHPPGDHFTLVTCAYPTLNSGGFFEL